MIWNYLPFQSEFVILIFFYPILVSSKAFLNKIHNYSYRTLPMYIEFVKITSDHCQKPLFYTNVRVFYILPFKYFHSNVFASYPSFFFDYFFLPVCTINDKTILAAIDICFIAFITWFHLISINYSIIKWVLPDSWKSQL